MSKSNPEFTDELISAYLDGELSDEQRRIVEQAMEREPRYRQMFDELVALRDTLHSLPQHQVDSNFHQGVMERVLKGEPPTPKSVVERSTSRDPFWRRFVWSGAAIAAAILVMVLSQGWDSGLQVSDQNALQEPMDRVTGPAESMPPIGKSPFADTHRPEWNAAPTRQQNLRKGRSATLAPEGSGAKSRIADSFPADSPFGSSDSEDAGADQIRPESVFDANQPNVDSLAPGAPAGSNDALGVDAVIYVSAPLKRSSPELEYLLVEGSAAQITEVLEQVETSGVELGTTQDLRSANDSAIEPESAIADEADAEATVAERQKATQEPPLTDSSPVRLRYFEANSLQFEQLAEILNQDLEVLELENLSADEATSEAPGQRTVNNAAEAIRDDQQNHIADDVEIDEDSSFFLGIPIFQLATDDVDQPNVVGAVDDDQSVEEEGQQTQADRHIQEQLRGTKVRPEALLEQLRAIQKSAESGRELRVLFVMPRETRP